MATVVKDLGGVTAYADAVAAGYTGTREEFQELMASYASVAQQAAQSAADAESAKNDAVSAKNDAESAKVDAVSAKNSAVSAKNDAISAKNDAVSAKTGAETAEGHAEGYATSASGSATSAGTNALKSEGFAVGQQNGSDVGSESPYYHNNAKYYAEQIGQELEHYRKYEPIEFGQSVVFTDGVPVDITSSLSPSNYWRMFLDTQCQPIIVDFDYKGGNYVVAATAVNGDSSYIVGECINYDHLGVPLYKVTIKLYAVGPSSWQGVVYAVVTETPAVPLVEISYSDLVALKTASKLIPGQQYRITDYATIINGSYDLSAFGAQGYVHYARAVDNDFFDVIVVADDESHLNENARACRRENSTYAPDAKPEAWGLKYTLDNDPTKYAWADSTNGKGVIYEMRDEHNNFAGYDFKNIQFIRYALKLADATADYTPSDTGLVYDASTQPNRYGSPYQLFTALQSYMQTGTYVNPFPMKYKGQYANNYDFAVGHNILGTIQFPEADETYLSTFNADWYYTFDYYKDGEHYDISSVHFNGLDTKCMENEIIPDKDALALVVDSGTTIMGLGGNCFEGNYDGDTEAHAGYCWGNRIATSSPFNTFGSRCIWNIFDNYCVSNIFGSNCWYNNFGSGCSSNTFGDSCYYNTFGDSCSSNTFGDSCSSNTFGDSCYYNTFGDSCDSNTFGDSCSSNTFGDSCDSNTFGDSCYYNTFGDSCSSNTFGDSCYYNTFGTLDNNNILVGDIRNLTADNGVNQITVPTAEANQNYLYELVNYSPQTSYSSGNGCATLITKTGYNTSTAKSTTDSGTTWA